MTESVNTQQQTQFNILLIGDDCHDIYTYGFIDESGNGVDYPFLNGTHYPSTNISFRVFPEGNVSEDILTIADPIIDDCE